MLEEMGLSHREEVASQVEQHEREKEELSEKLKSQHSSEMVDLQQANKLAVASLRETLELQQEIALREAAERHREEIAAVQGELASLHQAELSGLRNEHRNEVERHRQQLQEMLELRKKEVKIDLHIFPMVFTTHTVSSRKSSFSGSCFYLSTSYRPLTMKELWMSFNPKWGIVTLS